VLDVRGALLANFLAIFLAVFLRTGIMLLAGWAGATGPPPHGCARDPSEASLFAVLAAFNFINQVSLLRGVLVLFRLARLPGPDRRTEE
jgi:hypothetical protein